MPVTEETIAFSFSAMYCYNHVMNNKSLELSLHSICIICFMEKISYKKPMMNWPLWYHLSHWFLWHLRTGDERKVVHMWQHPYKNCTIYGIWMVLRCLLFTQDHSWSGNLVDSGCDFECSIYIKQPGSPQPGLLSLQHKTAHFQNKADWQCLATIFRLFVSWHPSSLHP